MAFRNSIQTVTVDGPVELAAGGVVSVSSVASAIALAQGTLVGITGNVGVTNAAGGSLVTNAPGSTLLTTNMTTSAYVTTLTLAPWVRTLFVAVPFSSTLTPLGPTCSLIGVSTGFAYLPTSNMTINNGQRAFWVIPVAPTLDAQVTLTVDAGASPTTPVGLFVAADPNDDSVARFLEASVAPYDPVGTATVLDVSAGYRKPRPLDVLPYGGATFVSVITTTTALAQILAAPAAGTAYRLHRFTGNGGAAGQVVTLQDSAGAKMYGNASGNTPQGVGTVDNLAGLLATESLWVGAQVASVVRSTLYYDVVNLPSVA